MRAVPIILPLVLISVGSLACRRKTPAVPPAEAQGDLAGGAPSAKQAINVDTPGQVVKGKVSERLEAAPYTYLQITTANGPRWAAVPTTDTKVGADVTILVSLEMMDFESKTLGRKFPQVYFGNVEGSKGSAPQSGMQASGNAHGEPAVPRADLGAIKVEKASGPEARTVEEAYAQKAALNGKSVVIRGKVVKFLPEIMKTNWLHLRDGSGKEGAGNNDVTVTTKDVAQVGDVVTVRGTLRLKRDFGSGYFYELIVEDAKVQK